MPRATSSTTAAIALLVIWPWSVSAADSNEPVPLQTAAKRAAEERVRALLDKPLSAQFDQVPLAEVLASIARSAGAAIRIDQNVRGEIAAAVGSPTSCRLSRISLRSALNLLVGEVGLAWTIDGDEVLVTTPLKASNLLVSKTYPAQVLIGVDPEKPLEANRETLIQIVGDTIEPTSWDPVGGPGSIAPSGTAGGLVVSQTPEIHEQIALLLAALRTARDEQRLGADAPSAAELALNAPQAITVQTERQQGAENRMLAILKKPLGRKFERVPLAEALADVAQATGLPIHLDRTALRQAAIPVDVPLDFALPDVSLRSALGLMLNPLNLDWTIENECLLVTTSEHAFDHVVTKIYPVNDLVSPAAGKNPRGANYQQLIQTITATVAPTAWDEVGGLGGISQFTPSRSLVISQTFEVHERVALLLRALRKARDQQRSAPAAVGATAAALPVIDAGTDLQQAAEARIVAALEKPFSATFDKTPLSELLAGIAQTTGLPILLDRKVLAEASIALNSPVSCQLSDLPLRAALDSILQPLELAWTIERECLLVTTPEKVDSTLFVKVYPVRDLVAAAREKQVPWPSPKALADRITAVVHSESWDTAGGPGSIEPFVAPDALVVNQTFQAHEEIASLLAAERKAAENQSGAAAADQPDRQ